MPCLAAKRNATTATSNRSGPTPVGTCLRLRKCVSTVFRPTAPPITTTALRLSAISSRTPSGGFYHDGRFATLSDVVDHYNSCMSLGLTSSEKSDLIQYLLSLTFGPQGSQAKSGNRNQMGHVSRFFHYSP